MKDLVKEILKGVDWFLFAKIFCAMLIFAVCALGIDLALNQSWLSAGLNEWRWYHYFTSRHGITVLYLKHGGWVLIPLSLLATLVSTSIYVSWDQISNPPINELKSLWRERKDVWATMKEGFEETRKSKGGVK